MEQQSKTSSAGEQTLNGAFNLCSPCKAERCGPCGEGSCPSGPEPPSATPLQRGCSWPRSAIQANGQLPLSARLFTLNVPHNVKPARPFAASGRATTGLSGPTLALVAAEARAAAAAVATFPSEISCSTFLFPISLSLSLQTSVSSLFSSVSFSSEKNQKAVLVVCPISINHLLSYLCHMTN